MMREPMTFDEAARRLVEVGRRFDGRGWVLGTSGNFSVVVDRRSRCGSRSRAAARTRASSPPATSSRSTETGTPVAAMRPARPSAETRLHLENRPDQRAPARCFTRTRSGARSSPIGLGRAAARHQGYEMLKGLAGVSTHEHREWIPILENDQDMARLAAEVGDTLNAPSGRHAFLLRRHGLYTWGDTTAGGGPARRDHRVSARGGREGHRGREQEASWRSSGFPSETAS